MQVSVIIPIYKAESYLKRCLNSVLGQTHKDLEIILINDGSPDGCPLICEKYKKRDTRIKVIHSNNQGQSIARNKGIELASGKYIFFVDADDVLVENAIERLLTIAQNGVYDVVCGNYYIVDKKVKIISNKYTTGEIDKNGRSEDKARYNLFKTTSNFGYVWGKLYKKNFIDNNKLRFDEEIKFMEDALFNLKAISFKPKYYVLNEPLYYYYIYDTSTSNINEEVTDNALKMLYNYEIFLRSENIYDQNIDLFLPLTIRVFCWAVFKKVFTQGLSIASIYKVVKAFITNEFILNLFFHRKVFKVLFKLPSLLETVFYSICILLLRLKLYMIISITFLCIYPIAKIYINKTLRS